jgi:hypothetical protein
MAGLKISELPATSILLEDDQLILSRGDSTKRIAGNEFQTKAQTAQLSAGIDNLELTTFTTISSLSAEVAAKKRWIDFIS